MSSEFRHRLYYNGHGLSERESKCFGLFPLKDISPFSLIHFLFAETETLNSCFYSTYGIVRNMSLQSLMSGKIGDWKQGPNGSQGK
jgi:hypothetical protein